MNKLIAFGILLVWNLGFSQDIAVLKYSGGGDWYANPTSLPNLVKFCNQNINTKLNTKVNSVDVGSAELFLYPFVHMTGHGNVVFSNNDVVFVQNIKFWRDVHKIFFMETAFELRVIHIRPVYTIFFTKIQPFLAIFCIGNKAENFDTTRLP